MDDVVNVQEAVDLRAGHAGIIVGGFDSKLGSTFKISRWGVPVYSLRRMRVGTPPLFVDTFFLPKNIEIDVTPID